MVGVLLEFLLYSMMASHTHLYEKRMVCWLVALKYTGIVGIVGCWGKLGNDKALVLLSVKLSMLRTPTGSSGGTGGGLLLESWVVRIEFKMAGKTSRNRSFF